MKPFIVRTLSTGLVLLIPLFFLTFTLVRSFGSLRKIIEPIVAKLDIDRLAGLLFLNALAALLLLALVFALGLLARLPRVAARFESLDRLLRDRVPGYSIFKGVISGRINTDTSVSGYKSVLVRYNDTARIGFEVERTQTGEVIVFLPNVPNPQTGTAAGFRHEDVEPLDIPPHKLIEFLNFYGQGVGPSLAAVRQARMSGSSSSPEGLPETGPPETDN